MFRHICQYIVIFLAIHYTQKCVVRGGGAPGDTVVLPGGGSGRHFQSHSHSHGHVPSSGAGGGVGGGGGIGAQLPASSAGSGHIEPRSSYAMLSEAMSQAVSHEFSSLGSGSADGACPSDDLDCFSGNIQDRLGMEAIRSLHRQLDDDDNGNIDLSESDDFLREELKYEAGYEKRHKAFHYNDDMHISVRELWEAWLRSEVHNWTVEQTTDWLAQSVQLPQYVDLFKQHKVTGAALPRLAVNNMHYVSNVLGIKDPIHKQKIALKAMDVVLFGPPRETGTRWKDYILVTLLLSAIIGGWWAYQQNKNAKRHLRRMAQDMEGLQKAEQALQEMQKELERARMEQENVATQKLDLERRLKEAPSLSSSSSDLELQQLKQEIEMLRSELSRAEVELVDHCWSPPPQLQSWLQYTYELENKNHLKKRVLAEKQLVTAREACEKLRKKRTSLYGAFVSTHGKSIDDVDRSIVEARNSLSDVTNELQERLHRWKQIEVLLGFSIVNNNGFSYLENVLYSGRNGGGGGGSTSGKSSRGRITNSTDDLDDDSVQGMIDNYGRHNSGVGSGSGCGGGGRDDSSASGDDGDNQSVQFFVGGAPTPALSQQFSLHSVSSLTNVNAVTTAPVTGASSPAQTPQIQMHNNNCHAVLNSNDSSHNLIDDRHSPSVSSERSLPLPPRGKKPNLPALPAPPSIPIGRAPLPPPRRTNSHQSHIVRSQSTETVPFEFTYYPLTPSFQSAIAIAAAAASLPSPTATTTSTNSSPSGISTITGNNHGIGLSSATTSSPAAVTSKTHGDPQMEDTNSTDSSSLDGEFKKRRRKLHFPFGKKSSKSKLA